MAGKEHRFEQRRRVGARALPPPLPRTSEQNHWNAGELSRSSVSSSPLWLCQHSTCTPLSRQDSQVIIVRGP
jgi:hypothetical protein